MIRGKRGRAALLITLQSTAALLLVGLVALTPNGQSASAQVTKTWTGEGADSNWSTAGNWSPNGAPVAGDSLIFPASAARQTNTNDLPDDTSFEGIEFTGGTYAISGNDIQVTAGVEMTDGTAVLDLDIGGTGGIILSDGSLRLNGANTFTGTAELVDGRLIAGSNGALGATGGATTLEGGILEFVDGVTSSEPIVGQDATSEIMSEGAVVLNGNIDLEAATAFVSESGNLRVDGVISGGGSLVKAGAGTVTFTAANTYAGATVVEAGILALSAAGTLGAGTTGTEVGPPATLALQNAASIEGEDVVIGGNGVGGGGALRVLSAGSTADEIILAADSTLFVENAANLLIETGITAANPNFVLSKTGTGALLVSDAASVDVDLNLTAGTLDFDAASDANLTVTGGTLTGDGSFEDVTFEGGRLLPGNAGEGRIESNTLVAESGVTFSFLVEQAGGGSYWVDGTGASLNLGGATLEVLGAGDVTPGTTFVLLQGPPASITGTFASLPDDAVFADAAGRFWRIEYATNGNATVSIVALVELEADLGVELESDPTVPQDTQDFELDVVLTNEAATAMPGVKVNITLPNGVEFVSGPAGCVGPDEEDVPQVVVCTRASLPAGETTITLVLEVSAPEGATLLFFAQIDWPGEDDNATNDNDTHSVTVTEPDEFPFKYFLPQVATDGTN